MRIRAERRWIAGLALTSGLVAAGLARANGFEAPVDIDRPAPPSPERVLPFPVVEEAVPTASAIGAKDLPVDAAYVRAPGLLVGVEQKDAAGTSRRAFEGVVVRQSRLGGGKVSAPPGGIGYLAEVVPAAAPLEGARLGLFGGTRYLVDVDLSIVTRKGVTMPLGEPTVLGSSVLTYATHLPLAGTVSAGMASTSIAGFEWGRIGLGAFEVSLTQPAWHSKIFRDGLVQGRIEEITPAFIRFNWISGTRTESVVVAEEEVKSGRMKGGEEIPLEGGRRIKVTRVDGGARRITLDTPDGAKTLAIEGDPTRLVEDTESRKKLIALGKDYAVVCIPKLSDFPHGEAHLAVYAKLHTYRRGEALDADGSWRVFPIALPTGHLLGLYVVNDKAVEMGRDHPAIPGPAGAFQLTTAWTTAGELETFALLDAKGAHSARVSGKGRTSIDLIAGGGPTVESLMARSGIAPAPDTEPAPKAEAPAPAPAPSPGAPSFRDDPVGFARPHLPWTIGGAAAGFILAALFGLMRRPRIGE